MAHEVSLQGLEVREAWAAVLPQSPWRCEVMLPMGCQQRLVEAWRLGAKDPKDSF